MKIFLYALLTAAASFTIYLVAEFAIGYLKALAFRPDIANAWESTEMLQSEAAFGGTFSPFLFISIFLGLAAGWWMLLVAYKKAVRASKHGKGV
ncbi:hypothetical protein [Planomicrobium sp. CPCC 101079]|uniref:hypothetical protein n=1 Tax=Planomicrobium sp. CPCC 101079 TaxID=2599618 RepID=UPI0011B59A9B|nr:hypothetical protein [Planomicrobium sp. CPCC 101079]TWT09269.1 hypothetical protein FQV28_06445 [Planomicrobium sp. CPCC 101079]